MINYNEESRRLLSTFYAYRNDIDIYTEDEEKDKEFYSTLFKRLLKPSIRINDITPLGNKNQVIKRCQNEPYSERKKIFIVDGDIGVINNETLVMDNLFVLSRYCIENFLIDENSICNFVYLSCGTKSKEEILHNLEFENWMGSYSESLIQLFIHFAILKDCGGNFKLYNAHKYHQKIEGKYNFNRVMVSNDIETIKIEILKILSEEDYKEHYRYLNQKWTNDIDNLLKIVSGKDYLIPILLIKSQEFKKSKSMPSLEETKINLVHHFNVENLRDLKEAIEN